MKTTTEAKAAATFSDKVARALRRAARTARKTARLHQTPVYFWLDGKVVSRKP
jgi:hypothetical protein